MKCGPGFYKRAVSLASAGLVPVAAKFKIQIRARHASLRFTFSDRTLFPMPKTDLSLKVTRNPFYLWFLGIYPILYLYSANLG